MPNGAADVSTDGDPRATDPGEIAEDHADLIAGSHFLSRSALGRLERGFQDARSSLASASLEGSERTAAEWFFDNAYLVRRSLQQLRTEFPEGFQRRLPRLKASRHPRVLAVAGAILSAGRDLDVEKIDAFLRAYQARTPLTIAELWALPVLMRWVVLGRLAEVLEDVLLPGPVEGYDPGTAVGRSIRVLRLLSQLDTKELFCRQSVTEQVLSEDPAGAYASMDFETRDTYRHAVETLAAAAGGEEAEVARAVVRLARRATPGGRESHVGHWLVGAGRRALERELKATVPGIASRIRRYPRAWFFGLIVAVEGALLLPIVAYLGWVEATWWQTLLALAACWIPSSVPAVTFVHWLLSVLVPPRRLPKLDFSEGVPRRFRTLVAVPTLLDDQASLDRLLGQLEVHYLSAPDPELAFALVTDHVDLPREPGEAERARLESLRRGVRDLNEKHGAHGRAPFHLLHRESRWNEAEARWMGWERKRGKLEELNRYLRGDGETSFEVHEGDPAGLEGVAFVLTLDSDTQLAPGAAARLIGALAHPLNRPVTSANGRVEDGYTVIQPRVEIAPRSARQSRFTQLFTGDTGIDIYTRAVSEVYQDLFGEGIYVGKGIYDVAAFSAALEGRVPENALVSHDLFEGLHGRAALATDIVVYEDYPPSYLAYLHRVHRWVRGDWQLLRWLGPWVPTVSGRARNRLDLVDRFKILDNLRRSLLAPALLVFLLAGWFVLPGHAAFWTLAALLAPGASAIWTGLRSLSLPRHGLGRWLLSLCFAAPESAAVLDAIGRVLIRTYVTRRRLLEWTTAAHVARSVGGRRVDYLRRLWAGPTLAVVTAGLLAWSAPWTLLWASPVLLVWLVSPEIAFRISRPRAHDVERLRPEDERYLRRAARRIWLFFETFVGPADQWLPPDHFQEQPRGVAAHRTSPTNIGLLLLSELSAFDLGYIGVDELVTWVRNTLSSLERLDRHRGHIYNWIDTQTLAPLEPRYVSTVDSGNLAACLMTLAVGCERAASEPPLRPVTRRGLLDAADLLLEAVERWAGASSGEAPRGALASARALVTTLEVDSPAAPSPEALEAVRQHIEDVEARLLEALRSGDRVSHAPSLLRDLKIWLERLEHQVAGATSLASQLDPGGAATTPLAGIPDACLLAREAVGSDATRAALEGAAQRARALTDALGDLAARARSLAEGMELRFLYDEERRLFHIGYDASADRLDPHYYDLLASEARIASFLAVMRREVPSTHWFTMGRPIAARGDSGPALLSWGGSMFEFLMPSLLMRSHPDTLLDLSCEAAVDRQMEYGRAHGEPWGISESGYAFLDGQDNYQYRSFGVPGLGLRRGLEEDRVVAPYASFLALPFRPLGVVQNLRALEALGMVGRYGFFEAADFHPERAQLDRAEIVRSYMAHHHGMSLVALDNHLTGGAMVERFHADPRVESVALLLDERAPARVPREPPSEGKLASTDVALTPGAPPKGWEPAPGSAQIWALGNRTTTALVSAEGGGGLRFRDLTVTRWQPDPVADVGGAWIYLTDLDTGESFGATPAPLGGWPEEARVLFEAGRVEFLSRRGRLRLHLRVAVGATEDVEIRELQIANEGDRARRLRVIGCIEPVLEPTRGAEQHPAFSKLFLRCTPLDVASGFVVTRAVRDGPPAPALVHRVVGDPETETRALELDREAFLGRWGSYARPAALFAESYPPCAESTLDPICASQAELTVDPGTERSVAFVTALAPTRQGAVELAERFGTTRAARWAIEDASRVAARTAQRVGFSPSLPPLAQRVLSALLASEPALRADRRTLERGRPSPPALWGRGISGDEPILVLRLSSAEPSSEQDTALDEVVSVHRYLRRLGVRFDVVLVDDAPSGYGEQGPTPLARWLAESSAQGYLHQRGGFHIVRADQTGGQDLLDLEAAAQVVLDARGGPPLVERLAEPPARPVELPRFQPAGPPPGTPEDPDIRVDPPAPLALDNSKGGFLGDAYVIRPEAELPAPWCNVLANPVFGCLTSEGGMGSSWAINAKENRLTPWRNDPVTDLPSEVLYLRDEETARCWSTTPRPRGLPTWVRHGAGHTIYELACAGLEQRMTVFVPPEQPVKVVRLTIHNATEHARRLTATYYAEWVLGSERRTTRPHVRSEVVPEDACLLARNAWSMEFADRVAFLASDRPLHGYTTDRVEFLGRGGDLTAPAALERWGLSGRVDPAADPCAALQVHLDLSPGETLEVTFFLGQAASRDEALARVRSLRAPNAIEDAWRACRESWDGVLDAVRVRTPDPRMDRLLNRWLLHQSIASRFHGRAAFYQSSGAFGFRDQLQDSLAFLHVAPSMTRAHLLVAAAHQFEQGDVLHWWHPPGGAGVRTRCSDDLLWLVYATAEYVGATGDESVLDEPVPFLLGDELGEREDARYSRFASGESGSLLEHCRRALVRGFTSGPHGLPLIGDGDWNDGMNQVGVKGRGESVWMAWFVHVCATRFARLLDRVGEMAEAARWRERLGPLEAAVEAHAWDGEWYRRAFHDDGTAIGSSDGPPPQIDSIAQSWAAISGAGDPTRVATALASAERLLVREADRLVLLLSPPFGSTGPDAGYIAAYPAGVRENGGQYTHAAVWLGWAHAVSGDGAAAHRVFDLLNPLARTADAAEVARYRVEPYVIAADVYGRDPFVGRGGWTWYTGAAAWTWRLGVEAILGLRWEEGALVVDPCIPPSWDGFEAWVERDGVTVHVEVDNSTGAGHGVRQARLDGRPIPRARVPFDGSGERRLEVVLGASLQKAKTG